MKTLHKTSMIVFAIFLAAQVANAQQQIPFQGMVSQGFGVAAWNADGTGPEPAATGHQVPFPGFGNQFYYGASRDYVSGNHNHACFAFLPGITEFPNFTQALIAHGYTPGQVKAKFGLVTLGDDEEGLDWFVMDNFHHSSHIHSGFNIFELDGEPMIALKVDYSVWTVQNGTTTWIIDFGYTPVINISGSSAAGVQAVAEAFLADLDGNSIRLQCESTYGGITISGNGRNGAYYNIINGTLTIGNPTLPFKGLIAENEGVAAWNADGTGPEPYGNGHLNFLYYGASVDYGGINPNPDACLGHYLEGSTGFLNTLLQLQYRNFEIGDMKMKMGLSSLGPDVEGEDWGTINGMHWLNQYNNSFIIEINGEPILEAMQDTNTMFFVDPVNLSWTCETSVGKVYNISDNASADAQFVALSFLRDLGSHYLETEVLELSYAGSFSGNGRSGAYYQIDAGKLTGVHENITFVPPGEVSGTWTAEGSPYYVDGHLEIANGETLIIEPGVKVAVRGPYHFTVQGCVKAEGTDDENIIFTRSNPNLYWDGFDYDYTPSSNDSSLFQHCFFEYSSAQGFYPYNSGGVFAIREFSKFMVDHCIFRSNQALKISGGYYAGGGAIALWAASPVIRNSKFENNHSHYGGAIFCYENSNPGIQKNLFYSNSATNDGGAIEIWSSSPTVMSNIFGLNNAATGGAIEIYNSSFPVISTNLLNENEATIGGAISFSNANGVLLNNTIVANTSNLRGGGIYLTGNSGPEIINNIIWNNQANSGGNQIYSSGFNNYTGFYYCNIEGGLSGFGGAPFSGSYLYNLNEDPLFSNIPEMPYMLLDNSPCINMGTPDSSAWYYPQYLPETCLAGNPRILNGRIDMGACEYSGILAGDANCDGIVNVLDVIAILNYILGNNPEPFCFENADIDGNGSINVLDATATINIITGGKAAPFPGLKSASAHIYLNPDNITLQSDGTLAGLQFEISGIKPGQLELALPGFEFASSVKDGKLTGLLYTLDNTPLPAGSIRLFDLTARNARWGEAIAANLNAGAVPVIKHQPKSENVASEFLMNVYPNPFREGTMISFSLPQETNVSLSIYNQFGQEMAILVNETKANGSHQIYWNAGQLPAGVYHCRLQTGSESITKKIIRY